MADTAAQVADVVRLLREWGHDVREVDGWQRRGRGSMTTRGRIEHHTAGGSGNAPSLRVVVHGRAGLRNSLSRWFVARDGTIYLVALGTSWHAGRGVKGSNRTLSGTESEHSGSPDESWSPASLDAQASISAAECAVFGVDPADVWDHREHAPDRKPDRVNVDSPSWRDRVRATPADDMEEMMAAYGPPLQIVADESDRWYLVFRWDEQYAYIASADALSRLTDRAGKDDRYAETRTDWQSAWFQGMEQVADR